MHTPAHKYAGALSRREKHGQAMIESIIVMFFLCIVFFLVFQYTNLLTVRTVLDYAAARAARARAVGFNDFMITKTVRIASMSIAGECKTLDDGGDHMSTAQLISRSGLYLSSQYEADTRAILDFELWHNGNLGWSVAEPGGEISELTMNVWQRRPKFALVGENNPDETGTFTMQSQATIESHYPYYLK